MLYMEGIVFVMESSLAPYDSLKLYKTDEVPQGYCACTTVAWKGRLLSFLDIFNQMAVLLMKTALFVESVVKAVFVLVAIFGLYCGEKFCEILSLEARKEYKAVRETLVDVLHDECTVEVPMHSIEFGLQISRFAIKSVGDFVGIFVPEFGRQARLLRY